MMSKLYDSILSYLALRRIYKADKIAQRCDKRLERMIVKLEKRKKELRSLDRKVSSVNELAVEDIDESTAALKSAKEALEAVRSEQRIADEITIPTLVQSNRLLLERASADTAEQVRRQVAHTIQHSEE